MFWWKNTSPTNDVKLCKVQTASGVSRFTMTLEHKSVYDSRMSVGAVNEPALPMIALVTITSNVTLMKFNMMGAAAVTDMSTGTCLWYAHTH